MSIRQNAAPPAATHQPKTADYYFREDTLSAYEMGIEKICSRELARMIPEVYVDRDGLGASKALRSRFGVTNTSL